MLVVMAALLHQTRLRLKRRLVASSKVPRWPRHLLRWAVCVQAHGLPLNVGQARLVIAAGHFASTEVTPTDLFPQQSGIRTTLSDFRHGLGCVQQLLLSRVHVLELESCSLIFAQCTTLTRVEPFAKVFKWVWVLHTITSVCHVVWLHFFDWFHARFFVKTCSSVVIIYMTSVHEQLFV